jgi:hypothetical protein
MSEQERRIKELEAQNAQMGEAIGQMAHDHAEQGREIARLMRENDELRELAEDAVRYAEPEFHIGLKYNVFCTRECQLRDSVCQNSDECKYPDYLHERLRELGIEAER